MEDRIIYKDLCYKLNGIFFKVHNELGRFAREKQYADLAEDYFKKSGIKYKREFEIEFVGQEKSIGGNRVDFLVENKIIVEFKVKSFISRDNYIQVQRYLQASNLKLGLLINFNQRYIKPRRIINSNAKE
ncbi:GxxExxY protein [Patescibacteria group bacterium]|nr:GxxExxY protein [Patescibacteria group bacterium]